MRVRLFFAALTAVAGASVPAGAAERAIGEPVSIFATIGHSEWCPRGNVRLELTTGRYRVTAPRTWRTCRRPPFRRRVSAGVLAPADLGSVILAFQRVRNEGLEQPACRNGGQPEVVYLSNGGDPTLRLTSLGRTLSPPGNRSCWSDAAWGLHRLLEELFDPRRR